MQSRRSPYGGCLAIRGAQTGFFHTERLNDRWMLVDPDGCGYVLIGMSGIGYYPSESGGGRRRRWGWERRGSERLDRMRALLKEKYPTRRDWANAQHRRLRDWGFNALLGRGNEDVDVPLPYAVLLSLSGGWRSETFQDVWSDQFEQRVLQSVAERCAPRKDDPWLIGYFTDNELPWYHSWGGGMLDEYLSHPPDAKGGAVAVEFVRERYGDDIRAFNAVWDAAYAGFEALLADTEVGPGPQFDKQRVTEDRRAFLQRVSERYHRFTYHAIKDVDPNHMVMGTRFLTGDVPAAVARGMRGNVDVVSTNAYLVKNYPDRTFSMLSRLAEAPLLATEFGYSARDSGVPMDHTGAIPRVVDTQRDRADKYEWYVSHVVNRPYVVGAIWWQYVDGFQGRYAGNFGLINWDDEPYRGLTDRMTAVNRSLCERLLRDREYFRAVPLSCYTIRRTEPLALDGHAAKYGGLDIHLDHRNRYEGFDFEESGLAADVALRHDADSVCVAARVHDANVQTYPASQLEGERLSIWELDGVELWFGHYQWLLYFDGAEPALYSVRSDPFPGVELHAEMLDDGYLYEARFPKSELVDVMEGRQLRFAIGVNDGRAGERFRQIYYPLSYEWQYGETFAIGTLEP